MAFIRELDITAIDSPAAMCRALQCALIALLDPANAAIYADAEPGDERRDEPVELRHESFIVCDQSSSGEWRISVSEGDSPKPVQLSKGGRRLVALGQQIGMDRAVAVLEGAEALTEDERYVLRVARSSGLAVDEVVRRLLGHSVATPDEDQGEDEVAEA